MEKPCPDDGIPAFNVALEMMTLQLYGGQMNGSPLPSELVVRRDWNLNLTLGPVPVSLSSPHCLSALASGLWFPKTANSE